MNDVKCARASVRRWTSARWLRLLSWVSRRQLHHGQQTMHWLRSVRHRTAAAAAFATAHCTLQLLLLLPLPPLLLQPGQCCNIRRRRSTLRRAVTSSSAGRTCVPAMMVPTGSWCSRRYCTRRQQHSRRRSTVNQHWPRRGGSRLPRLLAAARLHPAAASATLQHPAGHAAAAGSLARPPSAAQQLDAATTVTHQRGRSRRGHAPRLLWLIPMLLHHLLHPPLPPCGGRAPCVLGARCTALSARSSGVASSAVCCPPPGCTRRAPTWAKLLLCCCWCRRAFRRLGRPGEQHLAHSNWPRMATHPAVSPRARPRHDALTAAGDDAWSAAMPLSRLVSESTMTPAGSTAACVDCQLNTHPRAGNMRRSHTLACARASRTCARARVAARQQHHNGAAQAARQPKDSGVACQHALCTDSQPPQRIPREDVSAGIVQQQLRLRTLGGRAL